MIKMTHLVEDTLLSLALNFQKIKEEIKEIRIPALVERATYSIKDVAPHPFCCLLRSGKQEKGGESRIN